jgi:hypothetical protein
MAPPSASPRGSKSDRRSLDHAPGTRDRYRRRRDAGRQRQNWLPCRIPTRQRRLATVEGQIEESRSKLRRGSLHFHVRARPPVNGRSVNMPVRPALKHGRQLARCGNGVDDGEVVGSGRVVSRNFDDVAGRGNVQARNRDLCSAPKSDRAHSPWHWAPLNPIAAVIETASELACRPCLQAALPLQPSSLHARHSGRSGRQSGRSSSPDSTHAGRSELDMLVF